MLQGGTRQQMGQRGSRLKYQIAHLIKIAPSAYKEEMTA